MLHKQAPWIVNSGFYVKSQYEKIKSQMLSHCMVSLTIPQRLRPKNWPKEGQKILKSKKKG